MRLHSGTFKQELNKTITLIVKTTVFLTVYKRFQNHDHNILRLIFYQIFFLPQVKSSVVNSNNNGIRQVAEQLETYDIRNLKNIRKILRIHEFIIQCPVFLPKCKFCKQLQKLTEIQKMNFSQSALFHMKSEVCLKFFVLDCRLKQIFASNSLQALSILKLLTPFLSTILTQSQSN